MVQISTENSPKRALCNSSVRIRSPKQDIEVLVLPSDLLMVINITADQYNKKSTVFTMFKNSNSPIKLKENRCLTTWCCSLDPAAKGQNLSNQHAISLQRQQTEQLVYHEIKYLTLMVSAL